VEMEARLRREEIIAQDLRRFYGQPIARYRPPALPA
jgi:hypothetical protein